MTTLVRRVAPLLVLGVMFALAVRRLLVPPASSDMWFHLRIGREFLDGWRIARPGHLGALDTADWVPTQWLPQMTMAWVERAGGLPAVLTVITVTHVLVLVTIYVLAREEADPLPATFTTALAYIGMAAVLSGRPQVLSYLFLAVATTTWMRTARDGKPRYWLVLLSWAWVPVHGFWPIGIILGIVMAAGIALDRGTDAKLFFRLALIPALSAAASLLTPLGTAAFSAVASVGSRGSYFAEWGPPDFTDVRTMGVTAMAIIVVVALLRSKGPVPWTYVALLGLALGLALYSMRTVSLAAVLLVPLTARTLQSALPQHQRLQRVEAGAVAALVAASVVAAVVIAPARAQTSVVPAWVDQELAAQPQGARVLNSWNSGPYFLWRHPNLSLTMHGYGDVFTDAELERNAKITRLQPHWDDLVVEIDADVALLESDAALAYELTEHLGWRVVEEDDKFVLLQPPTG